MIIMIGILWMMFHSGFQKLLRKKERMNSMETRRDIFEIFEHDENYKYIMKRLLEASMEESLS